MSGGNYIRSMGVRLVVVVVALLLFAVGAGSSTADDRRQREDALEAAFAHESYAPGAVVRLRVSTTADRVRLQVLRSGTEGAVTRADDVMLGTPVGPPRALGRIVAGTFVSVSVGRWPSGLYFVRLTAPGRVGYAPFVVPPRRPGEQPVALVLPTRTWQAYNLRDDDRDGTSDTWYALRGSQEARLARPFLNRGVPPHFRRYDLRFLRWLHATGRRVDVLPQEDLDEVGGWALAAAYRLLLFLGHHEYVTAAEYHAVTEFRDRGGNLAFLSANNFFWRIDVRGQTMRRVAKWRDLGRAEAALIGVQYLASDRGRRKAPWLVRPDPSPRGSSRASRCGTDASSPRGTSRSTRPHRAHRRACTWWRRSRTYSARR